MPTRRLPDDDQLQTRRAVGERIQRLRGQQRVSQERLAECVGLDRQTIGYYELGRTSPTLDSLVAIARTLGVPLRDLMPE